MTDYGAIYAKASRENAPGIGRDNFDAGIAAVVAAAKGEALDDALYAVNDEQLEDDTGETEDDAYRSAINTAAVRIELLIQANREKSASDTMAAAHTTDLREQSRLYTGKPMPDSEGE